MGKPGTLVMTILTYKQFITEIDGNWDESKIQSFAQGRPQNRFF
jgi:hypothetical protein